MSEPSFRMDSTRLGHVLQTLTRVKKKYKNGGQPLFIFYTLIIMNIFKLFNKTSKRKSKKKPNTIKKKDKITIDESYIKGWRPEIREKNFNKLLLKYHKMGIKTLIVLQYEYVNPKRYNIQNELERRKLL